MFGLGSIRIGRLFGIPIELNVSWFLVFALVSAGLAFGYFPVDFPGRPVWVDVVSGVFAALVFFASIVVHEASHSAVARRVGLRVDKVTLFLFGGVSQLEEEPRTAGSELVMALAGPLASLALSVAFFGLYVGLVSLGVSDSWWAPFPYLAQVNALVAGFNLLPGFPMDGGRVVRSGVWWASGDKILATRVAGFGGQAVGWLLVAAGVYGVITGTWGLLWLGLLGLFIRSLAARSAGQFAAQMRSSVIPLGELALSPVPIVRAPAEVEEMSPGPGGDGSSGVPVSALVRDGSVVGAVVPKPQPEQAGEVPETEPARWVRVPLPPLVDARDALDVAARRFARGAAAVWVVDQGRLVGYVGVPPSQATWAPGS